MNINIYESYRVMIISNSSLLSEEQNTMYDNVFEEQEHSQIININGGKLMEVFSNRLKEDYISNFTIGNKIFIFEYFNYDNGENWVFEYEITGCEKYIDY